MDTAWIPTAKDSVHQGSQFANGFQDLLKRRLHHLALAGYP